MNIRLLIVLIVAFCTPILLPAQCPENIDQQQTAANSGTLGVDQWQSWTAGQSGYLTKVEFHTNGASSGTQNYTFTIYAGQGTGGTVLYSGASSFNTPFGNWFTMDIPTISEPLISTGSVYTCRLQVSGSYHQMSVHNGNPYAGGVYYSNVYNLQTGWDMRFRTYVRNPNTPSVSISGTTNATCFGFTNGGATTTAGGGNPGYTYLWSPSSQTTANLTSVGAGTYTVTLTDAAGCVATAAATITQPVAVIANAGPDVSICAGGSGVLTGSGGGTYLWSPATGLSSTTVATPTAMPATTTTYTLTVTSGGCNGTDNVLVTVNPNPTVTLGAFSPVCISASPFALTGGSPAGGTYSGPGVSAGVFNPASAGTGTKTITYTFTNGFGCTSSANQNIVVNALPVVTFSALSPKCISSTAFALSGGSPAGGTYSGPGVSGGNFNPSTAGVGSHTITYSFTDGNGCSNTATQTQVVNALPSVTQSPFSPVCENGGLVALSGGSPAGGSYSGTGVSGSSFDPSIAGVGTFGITYSFTDGNSCTNSATQNIIVNALPIVNLNPLSPVCITTGAFALTGGTPAGGTYSGTGVSGGNFNPSTAGAGTHAITYSFTDGNGCTKTAVQNIIVNNIPTVSFSPLSAVCIDLPAFSLSGGSPAGGTYSGPGVSGGNFDPSTTASGTFALTYTFTDGNGCTNTANQTQLVNPLPTVSFSPLPVVCQNGGTLTLSGGSPAGGTYSGTAVAGGIFDPSSSGPGVFTITYTFTDGNGCINFATQNITVNATPVVSFSPLSDVCIDAAAFSLSGGSPAGGTYSGPGVSAGNFNPASAGVGTHAITYSFTDANSCTNTAVQNIVVNALPTVSLNPLSPVCIDATAFALTGESPSGGTFSGTGVSSGNFDPSVAGAGTHSVTYTFTNAGTGCTNSASQNIIVNALPVVTHSPYGSICENGGPVTLSGGSPAGGVYSGTGVSGGVLDPAVSGAGTFSINYTFTDGNGCMNSTPQNITVTPTPVVTLTPFADVCIDATAFALTGESPTGGTFSGTGVSAGNFDPATAGVGTHAVTYSFTDANSCTNAAVQNIVVNALPTVTLNALSPVCVDATAFALTGESPSGGTFSGTAVSAGNFDPPTAGVGSYPITYTFIDGNGCTNSMSQLQIVNSLPVASFTPFSPVCVDGTPFNMMPGSPSGGIYSGPGITGGNFDPSAAGAGTHAITYTYTDGNGCVDADVQTVIVNALPTVTQSTFSDACVNGNSFVLTGGSPAGGFYSGTGVSAGSFDPAVAGLGTHSITYNFTDANSCTNTASQNINVLSNPVASFTPPSPVCEDAVAFAMTGGSPLGGVYSGTGISGGNFDPSTTGVGTYAITYIYSDASGCVDTAFASQTVNALPVVSLSSLSPVCVDLGAFALSGGSPAGGTFSGTGVSANNFNPSLAGAGIHLITYSFTDANGCASNDSQSITVNALPGVTFSSLSDKCISFPAFTLSGGAPAGGIYSGIGVSAGSFDPASAGAGTFPITYTFTDANSCVNSAIQNITINPLPTVTLNVFADVCINFPAFSLTGQSPTGGTFSGTGVSSGNFNPSVAGVGSHNITYTFTDANTCTNSAIESILVNAIPVVSAGADAVICEGASTALSATGASLYSWTPSTTLSNANVSNPVASPLVNTTYTVTGMDAAGCSDTDDVTVTVIQTGGGACDDITICPNGQAFLSASSGTSYLWSPGQYLNDSTSASPVATPPVTTTYIVLITDASCSWNDTVVVYADTAFCALNDVSNAFSPDGDGINDVWVINAAYIYGNNKVAVFNRWGNIIAEFTNYNNFDIAWDGNYNGEPVVTGTYYYTIELLDTGEKKSGWIQVSR